MKQIMQHGGNIASYQTEWGWQRENMVDFSANLNPLGPPASVIDAIKKGISQIVDYPDPHGQQVLAASAKKWGISESCFLLGNGAAELIFLAMRLIRPKRIATLAPAFREYEQAARIEGADIIRISLRTENDFEVEAETILQNLRDVDLLVLANPNNPTGRCIQPAVLEKCLHLAQESGIWLLVDEAFLDFLVDEGKRSLIPLVSKWERLIVIRSLTKFYAIPGIRIGYLAAAEPLVQKMGELQVPWSVNTLAQAAALAALKDEEFIGKTFEWLLKEREFMTEELIEKGYYVVPSDANFLLVQRNDIQIEKLWQQLAAKGLFVRDCRSFTGLDETWFRIAIRTKEENVRLLYEL